MGRRKKEKQIRNILRQRLAMLGKSQSWLADKTGISINHINTVINGKWIPTLTTAMKISEALVSKVDDLWFY